MMILWLNDMKDNVKRIQLLIEAVMIVALVIIDRVTKEMAVKKLMNKPAYVIIDGVFELRYLENRGAAFGMLQNRQWFFIIVGIIMFAGVIYILVKIPVDKKYITAQIAVTMIAAGAIGNMIDRISQNYVVDFLYFSLIDFPIFNVADIYVTVSCILLAVMLMFVYKEDDLAFLSFKKKENE